MGDDDQAAICFTDDHIKEDIAVPRSNIEDRNPTWRDLWPDITEP
jgi:hypothetical protein